MPRLRLLYTLFPLLLLFLLSACTAPQPAPFSLPLIPSSPSPALSHTPTPLLPNALQPPDPAALLRVLNHAIGLEREAWAQFDYPTFHGDFLTSPEARALFDFLEADLDRYYPNGLPHAGDLFTDGALDANIWFPPRAVWMLAQAGIVERLRAESISLTEGVALVLEPFTLLPAALELDGDPDPEWLVEVTSKTYNLHGWIPLDENNGYTLISNAIQHENRARGQATTLQFTPDLNGDGLDDLLVHFDGQPLGTQFGELKVYGQVAGKVVRLGKIVLGARDTFDFGNFNGDGRTELRVQIPRTYNFGCEWVQTNFYAWGHDTWDQEFIDKQDEEPPNTPLCNAATYLSGNIFTPETRQNLEGIMQAISHGNAPSDDYLALLQVHLAMANAAQHDDKSAGEILDRLVDYPHSPFAILAYEKWRDSAGSPVAFCSALGQAVLTGETDHTEFAPYLSTTALFQAYGNRYESGAPFLCPLDALIASRLLAESIPPDETPFNGLAGKGYPFLGMTEINLDDDPESEWVAALSARFPMIYLFNLESNHWKIMTPYGFSDPIQTLEVRAAHLPDPDFTELFLFAAFDSSVPVSHYPPCWSKGAVTVFQLSILQMDGTVPVSVKSTILCEPPPDFQQLRPEDILHLIPEPAAPVISPDHGPVFYANLEQFEGDIFKGRNLEEARMGLETLRSFVPLDHPIAPQIIPRLLFGIGLSYELEGDAKAARAAYLDLSTQWPASPWAWLAEARLHR